MKHRHKPTYKNGAPDREALIRLGFTIDISHRTIILEHGDPPTKTRRTTVCVTDPQGKTATGYSHCHHKDNWNRRLGIAIAYGRAWKSLIQSLFGLKP